MALAPQAVSLHRPRLHRLSMGAVRRQTALVTHALRLYITRTPRPLRIAARLRRRTSMAKMVREKFSYSLFQMTMRLEWKMYRGDEEDYIDGFIYKYPATKKTPRISKGGLLSRTRRGGSSKKKSPSANGARNRNSIILLGGATEDQNGVLKIQ